jgi:hypothetical protein
MLTTSILKKWKKQEAFTRFIDGETANCSIDNLQYVTLKDAMDHIHDWKVDWDAFLTKKEIGLVMDPDWRAGLVFHSTPKRTKEEAEALVAEIKKAVKASPGASTQEIWDTAAKNTKKAKRKK